MGKGDTLAKVLAVVGVVFAWLPVLLGLLAAVVGVGDDPLTALWFVTYLASPLALVGGLLLLWAAFRARSRLGPISWSAGAALAFLVAGTLVGVLTGLASGRVQEGGWQSTVQLACIVAYALSTVVLGAAGIALLRDLRGSALPPGPSASEDAPTP